MSLRTLDPAVLVLRGPIAFSIAAAALTEEGLRAQVVVLNGSVRDAETFLLGDGATRRAMAERLARTFRLSLEDTDSALVEALAEATARLASAPAPEGDEEWSPPAALRLHAAPPFPIGALPVPLLRDYVRQLAGAYETPPDFGAMGVLAALSGCIGQRRRIHIGGKIHASACLWIPLVGLPGSGKSEPLEEALAPLRAWHAAHVARFQEARAQHDLDQAAWEQAPRGTKPDRPAPPVLKRILVADATMESLAVELDHNPEGLLLYQDELAAFLAGFDRYRAQGAGADRAKWLEIWGGRAIDVSRKTGNQVLFVPHPFVSIVGTIQPDRLEDLLGKMEDGFRDRFLCVYPPDSLAPLPTRGIDRGLEEGYAALLGAILARTRDEEGLPRLVELRPDARRAFRARADAHLERMRDPDLTAALRGVFAKLRIYASRLTLILQQAAAAAGLCEDGWAERAHVEAAWDLVAYFAEHARKVHAARRADPAVAGAERILRLIADRGWTECSRRDIYVYLDWVFARPADVDPCTALLCDLGYLREREHAAQQRRRGRPPTAAYDVNPYWDRAAAIFAAEAPLTGGAGAAGDDEHDAEEGGDGDDF